MSGPLKKLRVPAVLVATLVSSAACKNDDDCHERCIPIEYRDAGVADAVVVDAVVCPAEPDPQTGECPPGCEPTVCFT